LDPYTPYLLARWNAGCHVGTVLLREIQAQGYTGGRSLVLDFFAALRKQQGIAPMQRTGLLSQAARDPRIRPATPRDLAWLVLQRPERLDQAEQSHLLHLQQSDPTVGLAVTLAQEFAVMVRHRQPEALDGWLERVDASSLGPLRSFVGGIRRDYAATKAALTLPYSNGVVEGNVNWLKYLKRQMYGRANFDLLRKRVLYAP
jgi:transposase